MPFALLDVLSLMLSIAWSRSSVWCSFLLVVDVDLDALSNAKVMTHRKEDTIHYWEFKTDRRRSVVSLTTMLFENDSVWEPNHVGLWS
jgi:hypothetical protein